MESNSGVLLCLKAFRKIVGYDGSVILPAAAGGEESFVYLTFKWKEN